MYNFCALIRHNYTNSGKREIIKGFGSNAPAGMENLSYVINLCYFDTKNGFGYDCIMTFEYYDNNGNCFYKKEREGLPYYERVKPRRMSQIIYDAVYARVYLGR